MLKSFIIVLLLLCIGLIGYRLGVRRSLHAATVHGAKLHSLPAYHGLYVCLWSLLPSLLVLALWVSFGEYIVTTMVRDALPPQYSELPDSRLSLIINDIKNIANGDTQSTAVPDEALMVAAQHYNRYKQIGLASIVAAALALSALGMSLGLRALAPGLRARNKVEGFIRAAMFACSTLAVFTTIGIVLSVLFEALRFFNQVNIMDFMFGLKWSPQMAIREDQVGSSGAFGIVPLMTGTLMVSGIALAVAVPVGLLAAIYMSEYASERFRSIAKPLLEMLAGIPTVVYGFFAALVVAPYIRELGDKFGLEVASESALAAGAVMGIMIIPFVSSLSDDVLNAVPQSMRDGSLGLGATQSETVLRVLLPAALPGIVGSILLAASRAIGETMIVVMAAGLTANLTANPLNAVTTVTVQIVTLLIGDQEFDSPKTLAAFALGLMLFIMTLMLNVVALYIVKKYREQYE